MRPGIDASRPLLADLTLVFTQLLKKLGKKQSKYKFEWKILFGEDQVHQLDESMLKERREFVQSLMIDKTDQQCHFYAVSPIALHYEI